MIAKLPRICSTLCFALGFQMFATLVRAQEVPVYGSVYGTYVAPETPYQACRNRTDQTVKGCDSGCGDGNSNHHCDLYSFVALGGQVAQHCDGCNGPPAGGTKVTS